MSTHLGDALFMVAGFLMALGALLAILDRIEAFLNDAVATRLDSARVYPDASHDYPGGLPEPRRHHSDRRLITEAPEPGVATHRSGEAVRSSLVLTLGRKRGQREQ